MATSFYVRYPSASASSNPANGSTGATAPTQATEVGFVDGSGNLQPFSGTNAASGPNVAITSSALPTGGATSANQVTQEATLTAIQANQTNGTQVIVLPSGASTSALQTSGNSSLTTIATNTTNAATTTLQTSGNSSLTTIATNTTNAATTTLQTAGNSSLTTIATNTTGLATASAQTTGNASLASLVANTSDLYVTGQSAQTAVVNNILTVASGTAATDLLGYKSASVQVTSTGTAGAYIFEGSNDNVNFQPLTVYNQAILTGTPINAAITASASQLIYTFPVTARYVRLRISIAITGGSIQAFSRFYQEPFVNPVVQVAQNTAANLLTTATLAAGAASIGTVVSTPTKATLTDSSGTTSGTVSTATTLMALNAARKYLYIQNCSSSATIWINFTTTAVTTQPSIPLLPYAAYVQESGFISTELISVISTVASVPFVAKYS